LLSAAAASAQRVDALDAHLAAAELLVVRATGQTVGTATTIVQERRNE